MDPEEKKKVEGGQTSLVGLSRLDLECHRKESVDDVPINVSVFKSLVPDVTFPRGREEMKDKTTGTLIEWNECGPGYPTFITTYKTTTRY